MASTTGPTACATSRARVHDQAVRLAAALDARSAGAQTNRAYFDTLRLDGEADLARACGARPKRGGINFRYPAPGVVQISLNETVTEADLADIVAAFAEAAGTPAAPAPARAVGGDRRSRSRCAGSRRS